MKTEIPMRRARLAMLSILVMLGAALVLFASRQASAGSGAERRYPPPGKMVDVGGHRLHINCTGEGSPTIIFEAGMSGWSVDWSLVQPQVAKMTRACSYDRAGYVWSEEGPQPRTSRQVAAELHTLLQRAGVTGPIILVGHSLGGLAAQLYASTYPREVAGLVLVDSVDRDQSQSMTPQMRAAYEGNLLRFTAVVSVLAPTGLLRLAGQPASVIIDKLPSENRPAARELAMESKSYRALAAEMKSFDESEREVQQAPPLPNIPVAVLSSTRVRDFPMGFTQPGVKAVWGARQSDLASRSPNTSHVVADRSGHYIHLDQPELVIAAITEVLKRVSYLNVL